MQKDNIEKQQGLYTQDWKHRNSCRTENAVLQIRMCYLSSNPVT